VANYRRNVARHLREVIREIGPLDGLLDFGAGNGWMLNQLLTADVDVGTATAVDVQRRDEYHLPVELYDGERLPFDDRSFDATMAVDVIHHCADPEAALRDAARVTRRFIILKDHTYRSQVGFAILSALDEAGNRKFGIPSRHRYQSGFAWDAALIDAGFTLRQRVHPLPCHDGVLSFTDRLQCLAVFERTTARRP
jgi:SAM-dependent methyltransferase